ncbi:MAG TPA: FISUMP domain-containing protein [Bacteroidales bacterium]|nr:FISUMP domain-containing protein [Bacteroidales bacterium]
MKQQLLFIVTAALMLLGNNNVIQANIRSLDETFILNKHTAYAPNMPSLTQVEDFLCGDVNEDGLVNVLDIITMVNYIMGGNPSPFDSDAADVNADGGINVLDVIGLVNIIMEVPGIPCGCVAPVLYEGQTYATVQIGEQCWFKENLNVGTKINSTQGGFQQTDNITIEKYCYNNDEMNCNTYGGLYEWPEAMQYVTTEGAQGICPTGWHIPTDGEFITLTDYLGGSSVAGGKMKSTGTIEEGTGLWYQPNTGATNESGFSGLPGGNRYSSDGSYYNLGKDSYFWSSSLKLVSYGWYRLLSHSNTLVYRNYSYEGNGFSIRCLKGCWPEPTQSNAGPDQLNVPGTSTTLAGNSPTYGTGIWAIVSGSGGTIVTPASQTSEFQGVAGNEYTLSWTITTQCGSSADEVVISFAADGFTCGDDLSYAGQSYATVLISTQCWMAENLNVGTKINSTQGGFQQMDNDTIEKYYYNNDEANCDVYGGLYEWPEAMQYVITESAQGICPDGWHIPTDNEWKILEGTVDSQYPVGDPEWDLTGWRGFDAGGHLKEAGTFHWNFPNVGGDNTSGFTGLPGGGRSGSSGYFSGQLFYGYFWSSSQLDTNYAFYHGLAYFNSYVLKHYDIKDFGFSIRCLKDD